MWTHPSTDVLLQLSESMQSLKLPQDSEDLQSLLSSISKEIKRLGERVKALEDQICEEQREPTPEEDVLTMLQPTTQ